MIDDSTFDEPSRKRKRKKSVPRPRKLSKNAAESESLSVSESKSMLESISESEFINNNSPDNKSDAVEVGTQGGNGPKPDSDANTASTRAEGTDSVIMEDHKENEKVPISENSQFMCLWDFCKQEFDSMDSFVEHVDNHVGNQPWTCQWSNCEKSAQKYIFGKKFKLKHHLRKSSPNV